MTRSHKKNCNGDPACIEAQREGERLSHAVWYEKCKANPACYERTKSWGRNHVKRTANGGTRGKQYNLKGYDISFEDYMRLHWTQDFKCAICGKHEADMGKRGLELDHNHTTNRVRELLCRSCNAKVGVQEPIKDIEVMAYINKHNLKEALDVYHGG